MYTRSNSKGFTIIEVMIVLVIAAVILLIVFLAVPALQRNSRNTQRRADVGRLSTAFLEYIQTNPIPMGSTVASNQDAADAIAETAQPNTFDAVYVRSIATPLSGGEAQLNRAHIRTQSVCNETGSNIDGNTSSGRVALLYWLETSSGMQPFCTQIR